MGDTLGVSDRRDPVSFKVASGRMTSSRMSVLTTLSFTVSCWIVTPSLLSSLTSYPCRTPSPWAWVTFSLCLSFIIFSFILPHHHWSMELYFTPLNVFSFDPQEPQPNIFSRKSKAFSCQLLRLMWTSGVILKFKKSIIFFCFVSFSLFQKAYFFENYFLEASEWVRWWSPGKQNRKKNYQGWHFRLMCNDFAGQILACVASWLKTGNALKSVV